MVTLAACQSATVETTVTTGTTSTTTTTIENDTCDRVGEDTVRYLAGLLDVLDSTALRDFTDRSAWPEELVDLERQGRDLDLRADALRCDQAAIQQRAFSDVDLNRQGPLARELVELLLAPDPGGS